MLPVVPEGARRRALTLLVVLLAPATAGCLSGDAAEEPDELPVTPPKGGDFAVTSRVLEDTKEAEPKSPYPDPRLNVTARWFEGDWWYYESNRSKFRRIVVEDIVVRDGEPYYKVREEMGTITHRPTTTTTSTYSWDFELLNRTERDGKVRYSPGNPELRFLPGDNTTRYNESGYAVLGGSVYKWQYAWTVRVTEVWPLYPMKVSAGTFNASHFRVASHRVGEDDESTYVFKERWFSPDVRADLQFVLGARTWDAEKFQLVAYRFKGERGGMDLDYLPY